MGLEQELALKYKYKKLKPEISEMAIKEYINNIPDFLKIGGDNIDLYSNEGTLITKGYYRIVIGDYGAFIEFSPIQIVRENIKIKEGQEYRIKDEKFKNKVKYYWFTTKDNSNCKIYFQQRTVDYADYKVGMFYISPYDIKLK